MSTANYIEVCPFIICTSTVKEVTIKKEKLQRTCPKCEPVGNNRNGNYCSKCGTENDFTVIDQSYKKTQMSPATQDVIDFLDQLPCNRLPTNTMKLVFGGRELNDHFEQYGEIILQSQNEPFTNLIDSSACVHSLTPQMIENILLQFKNEHEEVIEALMKLFGISNVQVKFGIIRNYS